MSPSRRTADLFLHPFLSPGLLDRVSFLEEWSVHRYALVIVTVRRERGGRLPQPLILRGLQQLRYLLKSYDALALELSLVTLAP